MFKLICIGQGTFQCPLVWNARQDKFMLDKSPKFRVYSRLVLLLDVLSIILMLILIRANLAFGGNSEFTIVLFFGLGPAILNVDLDVRCLRHGKELQQLVNTFLQLASSQSE